MHNFLAAYFQPWLFVCYWGLWGQKPSKTHSSIQNSELEVIKPVCGVFFLIKKIKVYCANMHPKHCT